MALNRKFATVAGIASIEEFVQTSALFLTGNHPNQPGPSNWTVVECESNGIREVPAGGDINNCTNGFQPGGTLGGFFWIVLRSEGGRYGVPCEIILDDGRFHLCENGGWAVGVTDPRTEATYTPNTWKIVSNINSGTTFGTASRHYFVWDEGVFITVVVPNTTTSTGLLGTYLGEVDLYADETVWELPFAYWVGTGPFHSTINNEFDWRYPRSRFFDSTRSQTTSIPGQNYGEQIPRFMPGSETQRVFLYPIDLYSDTVPYEAFGRPRYVAGGPDLENELVISLSNDTVNAPNEWLMFRNDSAVDDRACVLRWGETSSPPDIGPAFQNLPYIDLGLSGFGEGDGVTAGGAEVFRQVPRIVRSVP